MPTETSQVLTVFNKAIHHEDDSSDDKSEIEIGPQKESVAQEIGKHSKRLTTTFQIEIENRKVNQELWGVNVELTLYELKWTIDAILQYGFLSYNRESMCHDESKSQNKIWSMYNYPSRLFIYCIKYTSRNYLHCEGQIQNQD